MSYMYLLTRSFSVKTSEASSLRCSARLSSWIPPVHPVHQRHSVHSSNHPQLTITYTPMTPNYSWPSLPGSFSDSVDHLLHVVKQISRWMNINLLCLNLSKTEFILIGLQEQLKKMPDSSSISLNLDSASTHTFQTLLSA